MKPKVRGKRRLHESVPTTSLGKARVAVVPMSILGVKHEGAETGICGIADADRTDIGSAEARYLIESRV